MVSEMDRAVGGILAALASEGLTNDTLIVWCSDNGGAVRLGADNSPLRGGKGGAFEGGIRVPAAIWKPGSVEGGQTFTQMMTATDWLPTIAAAVEVEPGSESKLDGLDMWPALTQGEIAERSEPYVVGVFRNVAVIDGNWKYVEAIPRGSAEVAKQLFRIDQDPGETKDLAAANPDTFAALAAHLREFPRAPTVAPDVREPGQGRGRPGPGAPGKAAGPRPGGPPGRGGGGVAGWKEITKAPWVEAAQRD